jgi:polysaccharide pyruvyl transferase WcaK-like protein
MHLRNVALPWGIFGSGNIGDDAMLQGFSVLVHEKWDFPTSFSVASRNPAHARRTIPGFRYYKFAGFGVKRKWILRRADAYLIVGDTPVMDYLGEWPLSEIAAIVGLARARGKRIAFLGIGTESLMSPHSRGLVLNEIAPFVDHWTVRSDSDRKRLMSYGVETERISCASDLAWLVSPVNASFAKPWLEHIGIELGKPLVGVNVTNENWALTQAPELITTIGAAVDELVRRHDVRVMFFANEVREGKGFDTAAIRQIMDEVKCRDRVFQVPNRHWHPQQAMAFVASCCAVLSMRYHFSLFAALQGVPFISLSRLGKMHDLCDDIQWPYDLPLKDAASNDIPSMLGDLLGTREQASDQLRQRTHKMIERAWKNIVSLEVLRSGGNE